MISQQFFVRTVKAKQFNQLASLQHREIIKVKTVTRCKKLFFHEKSKKQEKEAGTTTIHEILETNSSFYVKLCTTGKFQLLFFSSFLLILTKFSFWEEG